MKSIEELYPFFQKLVSMTSGVTLERVILADQNRSPPTGNELYATYKPIPVRAYGQVRRKFTDIPPIEEFDNALGEEFTDLEETCSTSMDFILSVNFLNDGADNAVMRLHNANFRNPVSEFLMRNNTAWRNVGNCRNLTNLLQAGLQPRWQADIFLFIEQTVADPVLRAAGFSISISEP